MKPPCTSLAIQHDKRFDEFEDKGNAKARSENSKTTWFQGKPSSSIKRVWREWRRSSKNIDRLPFAAKLSKLRPLVASSMAIRILGRESSSGIGGTCVECGDWGAAAAPSLQYNFQSFATRHFFYKDQNLPGNQYQPSRTISYSILQSTLPPLPQNASQPPSLQHPMDSLLLEIIHCMMCPLRPRQ